MKITLSCQILCHALSSPWSSPGQNTGVGSFSLLQRIFPTQGLNSGLRIAGSSLPAEPPGKPPWLFSHSVVSNALWPHGLQHARLSCPSLSPGVFSNAHPLTWWCYVTVTSSTAPFFCHQSFPAPASFPMSCLRSNNSAPRYIAKKKQKHSSTQTLVYRHP